MLCICEKFGNPGKITDTIACPSLCWVTHFVAETIILLLPFHLIFMVICHFYPSKNMAATEQEQQQRLLLDVTVSLML